MPHVHIGPVEFLETALCVVIFTFLWRAGSGAAVKSDNESLQSLGRAMAAVYS